MLRRRFAIVGVAVVAGLGAVPAAWADNSGPPKPRFSGDFGPGNGAFVCHGYPGTDVSNNNGVHGTPGSENACE